MSLKVVNEAATLENVGLKGVNESAISVKVKLKGINEASRGPKTWKCLVKRAFDCQTHGKVSLKGFGWSETSERPR